MSASNTAKPASCPSCSGPVTWVSDELRPRRKSTALDYVVTVHCATCGNWELPYRTDRRPDDLPAVAAPVYEREVGGVILPCAAPTGARATEPAKPSPVEYCESFGYKCAWLALPASDSATAATLASKLLAEPTRASWKEGIAAAYKGAIFVSPAVEGWAFIVSTSFFEEADDPTPLLRAVGAGAQYFASDRVIGLHVAQKLDGKRTSLSDEEAVMKQAGRWGMNPQNLSSIESGPTGEDALGWLSYSPLALRQR